MIEGRGKGRGLEKGIRKEELGNKTTEDTSPTKLAREEHRRNTGEESRRARRDARNYQIMRFPKFFIFNFIKMNRKVPFSTELAWRSNFYFLRVLRETVRRTVKLRDLRV